jgi:hypothetical protein
VTEFIDPQGDVMVPLYCETCGDQIGVQSPGANLNPDVIVRCYFCAAIEAAEQITKDAAA